MIKKILPKSTYAKNVLTLMTGTGLAQAIPIAISPILTRIYSPEEFGVFALYMAIASVLTVIVTGRYELAIILPEDNKDAVNILALSLCLSVVISFLLLLVIVFWKEDITSLLKTPGITPWLYWIPASTLLMGVYQSLNYWSNRQAHYSRLAISRVFQSAGTAGSQLGVGLKTATSGGLIGGQILGLFLSTIVLSRLIIKDDKYKLKEIRKKTIIEQAKRYKNFPKFLIFSQLMSAVSGNIAVFLINIWYSVAYAGFFMLSQRVLGAPITFISSAITDVFRQEASVAFAENGECKAIYLKTLKRLSLLSLIPFVTLFFLAPYLFELVFGKEWRISGEFVQILIPMFLLRFIVSPLGVMFAISESVRIDLVWQIMLLVSLFLSFYIGFKVDDFKFGLVLFSGSYSCLYIFGGFLSYNMAKGAFK